MKTFSYCQRLRKHEDFCLQCALGGFGQVKFQLVPPSIKVEKKKPHQKIIRPYANERLEDMRFLINHDADRYRRTSRDKHGKDAVVLKAPLDCGSHREASELQPLTGKASDSAKLQQTHLSCRGEQPSMYFQLTVWYLLTTHHCLIWNILLPPWVSINGNTVMLALLIRTNSCLLSHTETQNCFA